MLQAAEPNIFVGGTACTTKRGFNAVHLSRERPECSTMVPIEDKLKAVLPYMVKRGLKIKFGKKA